MTTAPNAKCQRVLCTRCMPGLDSGYNSRNLHVCIFDCAVDSYLAFSHGTAPRLAVRTIMHTCKPRGIRFGRLSILILAITMRRAAAHNSSWQLLIVLGYWKSLAVSPFSLVFAYENLSRQTVRDKIVWAWQDCLERDKNVWRRCKWCNALQHMPWGLSRRLSTAMYRVTI